MPDIKETIQTRIAETYTVTIYIAGDMAQIRAACREYCMSGFCVSILPCSFCYTGALEEGAAIRIINYPRFPRTHQELQDKAEDLARFLIVKLFQASCSVVSPSYALYLSRRKDDDATNSADAREGGNELRKTFRRKV